MKGHWTDALPLLLFVIALVRIVPLMFRDVVGGLCRVRVKGDRVQQVLLGWLVLRERPAAEFVRAEGQLGTTTLVFQRGRGMWISLPDNRTYVAVMESLEGARRQARSTCHAWGQQPRRVEIDPAWLGWNGGVVPSIARAIQAGNFEELPVLADALEEAGCTDAGLLAHLRDPGPHFPGCWALGALLDKS
jgi:hypothetical protein